MELLDQKGSALLGATEASCSRDLPQALGLSATATAMDRSVVERFLLVASGAAVLVGCFLAFHDLALTGMTWDEWLDFGIARDYLENQSFLTNRGDPSQARLSHLVGFASFWLLGKTSYFAFKLPFVLVGLLSGLGLWLFLRKTVRPVVAAVVTGLYFTSPYVLSAMRAGGTAGDALVLALTVAFIITLTTWVKTNRFWPYGLLCGVACGCAIGAKWTSACLLPIVPLVWFLHLRQQRRSLFDPGLWTGFLAQQWVAILCAVLTSPTLALGYDFLKAALEHSIQFEASHLMQFGQFRAGAPFYYIPAVLLSKVSPVQLALFCYELGVIAIAVVSRRRKVSLLATACVASFVPMIPLATKGFQNAQYYLVFVPGITILSAITLNRWLGSPSSALRRTALWLMPTALLAQLLLSLWLSPDYLLAGRQFGRLFYGQFAGPATNHCQGLPFALREFNTQVARGGPTTAYVLHSCDRVMDHDREFGPIAPSGLVVPYPAGRPGQEHFVIIPTIYEYDASGEREHSAFMNRRSQVVEGCLAVGNGHPDFELWRCPSTNR